MGNYLITGASSGIGAACAKTLSESGHTVVLVARDKEKLEAFACDEITGQKYCFAYDLDDVKNIRAIFDFCKEQAVKLDGLIYSAGINADVPMKACMPDLFEHVMRVNCIAFAEMGRLFYSKRYSNDNSRILAISSSASVSCDKGMGPYSASKAALNAIVKTMAKEYLRRGILVNALLPAGVLTPMAVKKIETLTGEKYDLSEWLKNAENNPVVINENESQPLGIIPPSYLANIVAYLVTPENKYITGALLPVSAGLPF